MDKTDAKIKIPLRRKLKAVKLIDKGKNLKSVAKKLNVSPSKIKLWLKIRDKLEEKLARRLENKATRKLGPEIEFGESLLACYQSFLDEGKTVTKQDLLQMAIALKKVTDENSRLSFEVDEKWLDEWIAERQIVLEEDHEDPEDNVPLKTTNMPPEGEEAEEAVHEAYADEPIDENIAPEDITSTNDDVAKLLAKINPSIAIKKPIAPPIVYQTCYTCDVDFEDFQDFHEHLISHVSLPFIVLERIDGKEPESDESFWEEEAEIEPFEYAHKPIAIKSENLDISKFLEANRGGLTITSNKTNSSAALLSLKNLGSLSIKKVPSASENKNCFIEDFPQIANADLIKAEVPKLKVKIKHTPENQSFQIINGAQTPGLTIEKLVTPKDAKMIGMPEDINIAKTEIPFSIKSEPMQTNNVVDFTDTNSVLKKALIKNENATPPRSPAESVDSVCSQIKVKEFALEDRRRNPDPMTKPLVIAKVEPDKSDNNIIDIACEDSDKDDDEIIFVDSTHPNKMTPPITPKLEPNSQSSKSVSTPDGSVNSNLNPSNAKEYNINWGSPGKNNENIETIVPDKNSDALFESFLSNQRKEDVSDLGSSEYIPLDKLGPQHECETCNTRFTSVEAMENHRRITGHSSTLVSSRGSMALSAYQPSQPSFLMNSLLPVQKLAETVGKIANNSASNQFTHQQNITVNIQSYPGNIAAQNPPPPQPAAYNNYPAIAPAYPPSFRLPSQNVHAPYPGQYSSSSFNNQYHQFAHQSHQSHHQTHPAMYNHMNQNFHPSMAQNYPNQFAHQSGGQLLQQFAQAANSQPTTPTTSLPQVISMPNDSRDSIDSNKLTPTGGIKIQNIQTINSPTGNKPMMQPGIRLAPPKPSDMRGQIPMRGSIRLAKSVIRPQVPRPGVRVLAPPMRGMRPTMIRGGPMKRPIIPNGSIASPPKKRMDILIPDRNDNDDCQVVSMHPQRDGLPYIQSIQGSGMRSPAAMGLNSQLTVTKTKIRPTVHPSKDTNAMTSLLASRGIKVTPKQKIYIPNLGSNISVTPTRGTVNNFVLPEDNEIACSICKRNFPNQAQYVNHMVQVHPNHKHRCEDCFMAFLSHHQLQEHRRVSHNVPNAEMGIPVVDLSLPSTLRKLNMLGFNNFIPLGGRENGFLGIPVVSVQNAFNGNLNGHLQQLAAEGLLSLGPVKPLPKC